MVLGKLTTRNPVPLSLGHAVLACKFYFVKGEIKLNNKWKIVKECVLGAADLGRKTNCMSTNTGGKI